MYTCFHFSAHAYSYFEFMTSWSCFSPICYLMSDSFIFKRVSNDSYRPSAFIYGRMSQKRLSPVPLTFS